MVDSSGNQLPVPFKIFVHTDYVVLYVVFNDSHVHTQARPYQKVLSISIRKNK